MLHGHLALPDKEGYSTGKMPVPQNDSRESGWQHRRDSKEPALRERSRDVVPADNT